MQDVKNIIGNNIRKIRESKNISQRSLAKKCQVSNSTISRIDSGKTRVSFEILQIICKVLKCKIYQIFNEDEIMKQDIKELKNL